MRLNSSFSNNSKNCNFNPNVFIFNSILCTVWGWGFLVIYIIMTFVESDQITKFGYIPYLIFWFTFFLLGIFLSIFKWAHIAFLGYNCLILCVGLSLNVHFKDYNNELIISTLKFVYLVTILLIFISTIFIKQKKKIFYAICIVISIISVIFIELIFGYFFYVNHGLFQWIVSLIFCGYIAYIIRLAKIEDEYDYTFTNAILLSSLIFLHIGLLIKTILLRIDESN